MSYFSDVEMDPSLIQQMAYNSSYTESINKKMRVPDTITVAEGDHEDGSRIQSSVKLYNGDSVDYTKHAALNMEVPDRIVVSVGEGGAEYSRGETDLSHVVRPNNDISSPIPVSLQTPPRVLTLQERNLDSLDVNGSPTKLEVESNSKEPANLVFENDSPKSLLENIHVESKRFYHDLVDKLIKLSRAEEVDFNNGDATDSANHSISDDLDDVTPLQTQVLKLKNRVAALEKQQADQSRGNYFVYGITVALWIFNAWFLFSRRR